MLVKAQNNSTGGEVSFGVHKNSAGKVCQLFGSLQ